MLNKLVIGLLFVFFSSTSSGSESQVHMAVYIEPPYADVDDGKFLGVNIDIVKLFAQKLNKTIKYTECPFIRCMSLMRSGDVDIIVGIKKTEERSTYVTYLNQPYNMQYFPLNFYLLKDSNRSIKAYHDLKNLRIGTIRGALYFEQFDQDETLNKTTVTTYQQLIQLLIRERIDTFIEREESVKPWINDETYQQKLKTAEFQNNTAVGSYIAISKKSYLIEHIKQLNDIQKELLDSNKVQAIISKWAQ